MDKKEVLISQLEDFKERLSGKMEIDKLIFFGSTAAGKPKKWSDIDLIIVSKAFEQKKSYMRAKGLRDLSGFNYPMDILCYTPSEFKKLSQRPSIVKDALKQGIAI
ncbi:MAG TPA: nucleotidyltransferase domain-containing protein [Candidatus Nanoarchaeia archaeon]|nr:nucleotidyltransferase domain-containing protein [Candidatus Nanoarchaeia archaeon]